MLRPSPYGGTTAVALIPPTLIVTMARPRSRRAVLGRRQARTTTARMATALTAPVLTATVPMAASRRAPGSTAAAPTPAGSYGAGTGSYPAGTGSYAAAGGSRPSGSTPGGSTAGGSRSGGPRLRDTGEVRIPKTPAAGNRWPAADGDGWSAGGGSTGSTRTASTPASPPPTAYTGPGQSYGAGTGTGAGAGAAPAERGAATRPRAPPSRRTRGTRTRDTPSPRTASRGTPAGQPADPRLRGAQAPRRHRELREHGGTGSTGSFGAGEVPVVTGVPVSRQTAPPASQAPPSFDVFSPVRRPGQDGPGSGGSYENANQGYGAADTPRANTESYGNAGAFGNPEPFGNMAPDAGSYQQGEPAGGDSPDSKGLPRRVPAGQPRTATSWLSGSGGRTATGRGSPGHSGVTDGHAQHAVRHAARLAAGPGTDATGHGGRNRWKLTSDTQSTSLTGCSTTW